MESTSWSWTPLGMWNSSPMDERAGAVIDEQSGDRKAKVEMMRDVYDALR